MTESNGAVGEQHFNHSSGTEFEDQLGTSCMMARGSPVDREDGQVKKSLHVGPSGEPRQVVWL